LRRRAPELPQKGKVLEMTLEHYCALFSKLTRAPGRMWSNTTRNRAPHKPLLIFAVMDLVARGVLASRFISVTGELVEVSIPRQSRGL
jgi:putative restriction endonuclease